MNTLLRLSQILIIFPIGMFIYDAVKSWFVDANFAIRTMQQWWTWVSPETISTGRKALLSITTSGNIEKIMSAPGPIVMLVLPTLFYSIYRIAFTIRGGKGEGGMYKSRH